MILRRLGRPSLKPPIRPTARPPPPKDAMNMGRIGCIISLLMSLSRLTKPRRGMLRPVALLLAKEDTFLDKQFAKYYFSPQKALFTLYKTNKVTGQDNPSHMITGKVKSLYISVHRWRRIS
jgi:hypothetical protein